MFNEMWFNESAQSALAMAAREVIDLDGAYIEVGSWEGRSTIALANAIYPQIIHAVDWWHGSKPDGYYYETEDRDVYLSFLENMTQYTAGNYAVHRMRWEYFAHQWDKPIKFIFIDAEHTYQSVYDNIQWARTLLVPGGIICGDDFGHPPVANAVKDALGTVDTNFIWRWKND